MKNLPACGRIEEGTFPRLQKMVREVVNGQTEADTVRPKEVSKEPVVVARPPEPSNFEQLISAAGPVVEPLAQTGLVVVLLIFMLIQREDLRNRLIGLPGHARLMGTTRVLVESAHRISRFLLTQTLINVGFGTLFALGLLLIGVPYALLWGGLAVVLRFVPFIGSIIASVFPLVLAFAVAPGWTSPVLVLVLVVVLELATANVAEPLLIGHGTGVSPIALFVAAAFWTWVWGPIRSGACHAFDGLPGRPRPELCSAALLCAAARERSGAGTTHRVLPTTARA